MTNDQKLELGIEIISAMKASAYDVPIEDGRLMALEDTEVAEAGYEDYNSLSESTKKFIKGNAEREKVRLHKQAMFVADIALKKILDINP